MMAPTNSLSLSIGTATTVRAPAIVESTGPVKPGGTSKKPGSLRTSAIWTVCFVRARRPSAVLGDGRCGPVGSFSAIAGVTPCVETLRNASPSHRNSAPNFASQIRVAFPSIVWNTPSNSLGELLMTPRTSEVAVCCSSELRQLARARLHLVEQPHVLNRDHRLVGKGFSQFNLLVRERFHNAATAKHQWKHPREAVAHRAWCVCFLASICEPPLRRRRPLRLRAERICSPARPDQRLIWQGELDDPSVPRARARSHTSQQRGKGHPFPAKSRPVRNGTAVPRIRRVYRALSANRTSSG